MNSIDWSQPQIIAAIVVGLLSLVGVVAVALINRSKASKDKVGHRQISQFSTDVQQIQASRDVTIGESPKRKK